MLSLLRIKNLAIVEDLEIEFGSGMNVLTGETGAGKSIVLKAISLLSGVRASNEIIRAGQNRCEVEGLFVVSLAERQAICADIDEASEFLEEDELLIRRVIEDSGRSRVYANSRMITAATLQRISRFLFDITGQHQQQSLLDVAHHRAMLDEYGVPQSLLDEVRVVYGEYSAAKKLLDDFQKESGEKAEYFRRIAFECEELDKAALREGERAELDQELGRLQNVEVLGASVQECLELIEGEEGAISDNLSRIRVKLESLLRKDPQLQESYSLVDSAYQQVKEAGYALNDYAVRLEADPERLEIIRERIAEIARIERKYRKDVRGVLEYKAHIEKELSEYEAGEFDEEKLKKRVHDAKIKLSELEDSLTVRRKQLASSIEKLIEKELAKLNMKRARMNVSVSDGPSTSTGKDIVEFMLAANPGEPFRSLAKVASGGELSRVLLVLKTILNEKLSPGLQIFDEVDTGIGGAVAEIVGEKLKEISNKSQVLLVTHAPQIAALADNHFVIAKKSSESKTTTSIKLLSAEERVGEVARMLAGKNVSDRFLDSARELMRLEN